MRTRTRPPSGVSDHRGEELFEAAARSGRRELAVRGDYLVDVSFGDVPT
jgi:hypothetical protein